MVIQVHHWYNNIVRDIFAAIDSVLLRLLTFLIRLIFKIAFFDPATFGNLHSLYTKIYVILTVYMLFKLTFTFFNYIINPEALSDQKQGVTKIIRNSIIMIILLIILPGLFSGTLLGKDLGNGKGKENVITRIQKAAVPILSNLLLPNGEDANGKPTGVSKKDDIFEFADPEKNDDDSEYLPNKIAVAIARVFYHPAKETYEHICHYQVMPKEIEKIDDIQETNTSICEKMDCNDEVCTRYKDNNFYQYSYVLFISTLIIGFLDYLFIRMAVIVGKRAFKLIILEIIFPIPVIMLIDPKAMDDASSPFHSWLHSFVSTFLDLFFQLGSLFLFLTLISMLIEEFNNNPDNYDGFGGKLLQLTLIISLVTFSGEVPSFVKKAFGVKEEKSPTDELGSIIGNAMGTSEAAQKKGTGLVNKVNSAALAGGKKVLGAAGRGAQIAAAITGGLVGGARNGGLRGALSGANAGVKSGLNLNPNKSLGSGILESVKDKIDRTSAGRSFNEEVDRMNANASTAAIADAVNGDTDKLSKINGDDAAKVSASISSGEQSVRNYAEAQAAKAKEEYNQASDKYNDAMEKAAEAEKIKDPNKAKREKEKWVKEASFYKAAMARAETKYKTNSAVAEQIKNKQAEAAQKAKDTMGRDGLADINGGVAQRNNESIMDYAQDNINAANQRITQANADLTNARNEYNRAQALGDEEKAARYAGEMQKYQSIIDENKQIVDTNKEVMDNVKDGLKDCDPEALALFNGDTGVVAAIEAGNMTKQSYAASKAEEARGQVVAYTDMINDATVREASALAAGDTERAAQARALINEATEKRDAAQHRADVNSEFVATSERKERELADRASSGNLQALIDINATVGGGTPPPLSSLSTTADVISYTNAQMSTYDALASTAEANYRTAVHNQATASDPAHARMYAMEAEQYRAELEEYSRIREANHVAQLTAIANDSSYSGDFTDFSRTNLEVATPDVLTDPLLTEAARQEFAEGSSGIAAEYSVRCQQAAADYKDQIATIDSDIAAHIAAGRLEDAAQLRIERTEVEAKLQVAERMAEVDRELVTRQQATDRDLATKTKNGDFEAFMTLTGADTATRTTLSTASKADKVAYAHTQLTEYRNQETSLASREATLRAELDGDRSSLSDKDIRDKEAAYEKVKAERKQNELKLRATQSYESRLLSS